MVEDGVGDLTREAGELQEVAAGPAVQLDDGELRRAQARGLAEDLSRHGDLADVVHGRGKAQQSDLVIGVAQASRDLHRELGDATLVPGGIGVACPHGAGERGHRALHGLLQLGEAEQAVLQREPPLLFDGGGPAGQRFRRIDGTAGRRAG